MSCLRLAPSFAFLAGAAMLAAAAPALAGTFDDLAGSWSGTGSVTTSDGGRESIRCLVTNSVSREGASMRQIMRCASDSYKFDIGSTVTADGDAISGSWSESTRGVTGAVSGSAGNGRVHARVQGAGFTAQIDMAARGNVQSVNIRPTGTDVTQVSLNMRRRGG